jgi:pimeloyl-ACP methyl ester carboxylesterase
MRCISSSLLLVAVAAAGAAWAGPDPVETLYATRGPYRTFVEPATGPGGDYYLFVPRKIVQGTRRYPILTWGNGTFGLPQNYLELLDHLASHGFVVIAAKDFFTGTGEAMIQGVDWLLQQNADPGSPLYQTLDPAAIGATGHSQGGQGTINAGNDPRVTCTAPIQGVAGEVDGLQGPMFALAGESDRVVPAQRVADEIYRPARVPSVLGVLRDSGHLEPLGDGGRYRGYLTAWFAACLRGDELALEAFLAPCTLCDNPDWEVYRKPARQVSDFQSE